MSKLLDLVDRVRFAVEDVVYSVKNKVLNAIDYVKYDVLKKDYNLEPLEFKFEDEEEKAPKVKKKKKSSKKKKK